MDNATGAPKLMSLHLLEEITDGFSKHRKLGGGAYGDVYLGQHKDGVKIAVKVLKDILDLDDEQFEKEYRNLAILEHKNVVRLVGSCNETKGEYVPYDGRMVFAENARRMLCFEYMCNGSLENFIYDESNARNWLTRYAIIKGICEGLEYLHEKLKPPMYHLDIKPANILLDENMSPKVADFGVSRLFLEEKTKKTISSVGTLGYVPPEYIDAGLISVKFDIFSLGVVIIKIMTGRDGYFRSAEMSSQQFVELVHTDWMNRLQATSLHMYSVQVRRCIKIALSCVEADRHKRPSIGVIVSILNEPESKDQILDVLRNGLDQKIPSTFRIFTCSRLPFINGWLRSDTAPTSHKLCPCISNDTEMLDILKNKLISYPLRVTNNRGGEHVATITTIGDPAGDTSTSELVKPRIKILYCTEGLGSVFTMDVHSTEPWLLLGHYDGVVSIWNHQNQKRVMAFHLGRQGEAQPIYAAKFIEPMQSFVAGDYLGYIHVYSYVLMERLQRFRAHAGGVKSLAVHPSEPFVLSASEDRLIKLWKSVHLIEPSELAAIKDRLVELPNWETAGWQCIRTFKAHSDRVHQVKFNPQTSGNTFASSSRDSTIKIWNIDSPTPVATLDRHSGHDAVFDYFTPSGDKQYLVTGSWSGNARIFDLQTNTSIERISGLQTDWGCKIAVVEGLAGRPILVTVSHDYTVAFCDSTTHRYENRVNFNLGHVWDVAYIKRTKSLAFQCANGIAIMQID